jgi:hypothetical protein
VQGGKSAVLKDSYWRWGREDFLSNEICLGGIPAEEEETSDWTVGDYFARLRNHDFSDVVCHESRRDFDEQALVEGVGLLERAV